MILNPEEWLKPKEKPYFHQISLDCTEKLVECETVWFFIQYRKYWYRREMDCDNCLKMQEILSDEIEKKATEIRSEKKESRNRNS